MERGRVWDPLAWRDLGLVGRLRAGDMVRNPVAGLRRRGYTMAELGAAYQRAEDLDAALAARGLRIDHPAALIGFVEEVPAGSMGAGGQSA